jgi:DNA-directed RNA polymerase subunit RPC12/RpoP
MSLACPQCGSRHLRYSRLRTPAETLLSFVGIRPLRCRDCRVRFTARTWHIGNLRWARCPQCWRMDLSTWTEKHYPVVRLGTRLALFLGAHRYRCEYCRLNFAAWRPRLERFSFHRNRNRATETVQS